VHFAVVIDRHRPGKGGLEAWLEGLAARLRGSGHELHLVSADAAGPPGFVHHPVRPRGLSRARRDLSFARRARDLCRESGFPAVLGLRHCLLCHVYAPHGGSMGAAIEAHRRAKRLPSLPSAKLANFVYLERELLEGPEPPRSVIAVSNLVRRDLAARFPGIASRIRVVPNGVDLDRFRPGPGGDGVVAFVAGNPRLKGWRQAREAFALLRRRGEAKSLLVLGGDPGRLPAGATWLGRVDRPEEVLGRADVLLHPTFYDPFPLVTLEALACGTPVVTTERNGAVDHLGRDGPIGVVAEPGDVEELARHAAALIRAAPRAEARRIAERFPLAASLRATEDLLVEAASGRAG